MATIQWTFAGSVITNNSLFLITEGSTRLDITNITTSYSGAYHCNASNVAGASVATINVDVQGLYQTWDQLQNLNYTFIKPPYFTVTPPHNVSVRYISAITLNCSSGGVPLPNITWFKDGIVIPTDQYTSSNQSDTLITMLTVVGSLTSHGYYTCQAINDLVERRVISTTVNVTVFEPLCYAGIDPSSSITLNQSDTFTANCSFSGLPLPVVSWYFLNKFLSNIGRVSITTDTQDITVTSTLRIRNVKKSTDEGVYHCIGIQASTYNVSRSLYIICNNSCEAGYTLNTTTCTCSLSNICELSPCQNGVNYIVPNISVPVSFVALLTGSSVTLRCVLNEVGNPMATIQWTFAGS
uniref:Ig-like domain-containing protein n=1 Tax=Amphimedon queenslandica TaxID=400682 RepID=A0A1X7SRU6_AMPQE